MTHRKVQRTLYEYLNNRLEAADRATIESHLVDCKQCAKELKVLREALLSIPSQSVNPSKERPELYWQYYASKVEARINRAQPYRKVSIFRFLDLFTEHRRPFGIGFASALALMLLAFGVWGILQTNRTEESMATRRDRVLVEKVALESRAYDYLDRSKVLLLGLVNVEPGTPGKNALERQRRVSKELLNESKQLASVMKDPSYRQLRDLISDLEVILLQIANLEAEYDSPAIEILRSGVDRKGILLKINLEEIQRGEQTRESSATPDKLSTKPTT